MGVPALFKNIIKNYPQVLTQVASDTHVARFFIDLNGCLHNCCGKVLAKYSNKLLPSSEELHQQMAAVTLTYMDHCISLLDPDEVFAMTDGPAPYAKINTQRHRRFKAAKVARLKAEWAADLGIPNQSAQWDTNAISPGTEFMITLMSKIKEHYKAKTSGPRVLFSSCTEPGEGEHKAYAYLRNNCRDGKTAAIWGLDADLIILGLTSGLPNLYLFREHVPDKHEESNTLATRDYDEVQFDLFSIDTFSDAFQQETFEMSGVHYDNKKILKDYSALITLLGNDFLPHILGLSIKNDGIEVILKHYFETLKQEKQHLILPAVAGKGKAVADEDINGRQSKPNRFNMSFLKKFLKALAGSEEELVVREQKLHHFKPVRVYQEDPALSSAENELAKKLHNLDTLKHKDKHDPIGAPAPGWKERYYATFFGVRSEEEALPVRQLAVEQFMKGVKWTQEYYSLACPDWSWYYQMDRAPLLSDLAKFCPDLNAIQWTKSKPLKPFEQLMFVLPPQSAHLLPKSYGKLMTDIASPLLSYYPIDFELDTHGAPYYGSAVPRLPVFDVDYVKSVTEIC